MECSPLLFLDVDGVLNSVSQTPGLALDPVLVARCARLIATAGASVVLTSTWRCDAEATGLVRRALSAELGGHDPIVGITPSIAALAPRYPVDRVHSTRCDEIALWIWANTRSALRAEHAAYAALDLASLPMLELSEAWRLPSQLPPVRAFCIVDDLPLASHGCIGPLFAPAFVRADATRGLSEANVACAQRLLAGELSAVVAAALWRGVFVRPCANPRCAAGPLHPRAARAPRSAWAKGGDGAWSSGEESGGDDDHTWVGDDGGDAHRSAGDGGASAGVEDAARALAARAAAARCDVENAFAGAQALLARLSVSAAETPTDPDAEVDDEDDVVGAAEEEEEGGVAQRAAAAYADAAGAFAGAQDLLAHLAETRCAETWRAGGLEEATAKP